MAFVSIGLGKLVRLRRFDTPHLFELAEFFALAAMAFAVPILFAHSQVLAGPVVNLLLIWAAVNTRGWKKLLALITLPSVSALIAGAMFGSLTISLLYLLPFIWIGNALIVFVFKALFVRAKKNFLLALAIAAPLKAGFLFAAAFLLYSTVALPAIFLTAMGIMQLATAIAGGLLALPATFAYKKFFA